MTPKGTVYKQQINIENENGFCKFCGFDFDGEDMVETFKREHKLTQEKAEVAASFHGYGPKRTKWSKQIGITGEKLPQVQCPNCKDIKVGY